MIARRTARVLVALAVVSGACKTDDARRPDPPPGPNEAPPVPHAGTTEHALAASAEPLTLGRVEALAPTLPGAAPLAPLRLFQADQARQTWCVPGDDAAVIAEDIARALRTAGWDDVTTRGTAQRAGAAGTQDGLRASFTVGGRDAACPAGRVATAHYHGATVTLPAVTPGEPIR